MIISELITRLTEIESKFGDIDVTVLDPLYKPEEGQWTGNYQIFTHAADSENGETQIALLVPHSSFVLPEDQRT